MNDLSYINDVFRIFVKFGPDLEATSCLSYSSELFIRFQGRQIVIATEKMRLRYSTQIQEILIIFLEIFANFD